MKIFRIAVAALILLAGVACSNEKKVGSEIDLKTLSEKSQVLGKVPKSTGAANGGFLGQTNNDDAAKKKAQDQAAANQAEQNAKAEQQKKDAAVKVAITQSGYDPYVIRVYVGGVVIFTNNFNKPASVTADRGEFDSGPIAPGASWQYQPKTAGEFNFHDMNRVFVIGKLQVLPK